jgi:esterase/lipase
MATFIRAIMHTRIKSPPEVFAIYIDATAPLDARHYIGHAALSHLFFQFAHDDTSISAEDGERYFELASEPKQMAWYENSGHAFNAQAHLE